MPARRSNQGSPCEKQEDIKVLSDLEREVFHQMFPEEQGIDLRKMPKEQMQEQKTQFYGGDGIVTKGVENTIRNVGRLARQEMAQTDREIISMMVEGC